MEGANVEAGFAQRRANATDKARRIFVDNVEHVTLKLCLKTDAENLDQTRLIIRKKRPRDRPLALAGIHGHADKRMICARFVMADFANVKPALFSQIRRVDHVHRIGKAAHKTGQHCRCNRLHIELGRRAFDLDRDVIEIVVGKLPYERTQFLRQRHIGFQLRCLFSRQAGHIQRIGDAAIDQIIRQLFGHLNRDIDLRFIGRCAQMRGRDEIRSAEQR